jgi:hypothetical protein
MPRSSCHLVVQVLCDVLHVDILAQYSKFPMDGLRTTRELGRQRPRSIFFMIYFRCDSSVLSRLLCFCAVVCRLCVSPPRKRGFENSFKIMLGLHSPTRIRPHVTPLPLFTSEMTTVNR